MTAARDPKGPAEPPLIAWRPLILLAIVLTIGFYWFAAWQEPQRERLSYTAFQQELRAGNVTEVTLADQRIRGTLERQPEPGAAAETIAFETIRPPFEDPELMPLLNRQGVSITAEQTEPAWWQTALAMLLPWVLIILLIVLGMRYMASRMTGGQGSPFSMGRSKAKRFAAEHPDKTMADVAGSENAKRDLREIIDYLQEPRRYQALGANIPRGLLMMGPPGTGKTLMAKAVAGEAGVPFFSISGSEFIEMFVGVGAARVRDMFEKAKAEAPSIIFIDELDSIGRARGTGLGGGHDEREQTLNQILSEMDGFEKHEAVVVLAATNRPDVLDAALLRPGRFDRKVILEQPHKEARRAILKVHTRRMPLAADVDLDQLAARTIGFSGADLENLTNEAALLAGRARKQQVQMGDFAAARDRIVLGAEREAALNESDKEAVAHHEAGHALLAELLPHTDPLDKVSILPRGQALGVTEQTPREESYNLRYSYLRDRIGVMLGGRAAERLIFGEVSTGAESDLKQATALARRMVSHWGMNERLGPVAFRRGEEHVFLGREMTQPPDFSEHTARIIDEEIRRLIGEIDSEVASLLERHRDQLQAIAQALLEHETLDAAQIRELITQTQRRPQRVRRT